MKPLILKGAQNGGRLIANAAYVANAYESLKLAAERPGAPICGNRVFLKGDSVFVQRGSTGPDEKIITMSGADGGGTVSTYHGGHFLEAGGTWRWLNGTWNPNATVPQDLEHSISGSTLGRPLGIGGSPITHDLDSVAFEGETSAGPPRTFDLRLGLLSDPFQNRLVTSFDGIWNNDAISIPPVGSELLVGVMRDDGTYSTWDVYAVHMGTGNKRFLFIRTGVALMVPGFSEDGSEFSVSSYRFDGSCNTEFLSASTGLAVRAPVTYAWGLGFCRGNAVWGAIRVAANRLRQK